MPRRKSPSDASKINQGRGVGHGKDYVPFDKVRDVPSKGLSHRCKSKTTGRVQHLLSTLEHDICCILDWAGLEVREQYPLPLEDTLRIAERLSIKHPTDPYTKKPRIIRIDCLVTLAQDSDMKFFAISGKLAKDLESERQIEKFEIERTWCAEHGYGWGVSTEHEILKGLTDNLEWVRQSGEIENMPGINTNDLGYYEGALLVEFKANPDASLSKSCISVDKKLGLQPGTGLWLVQHFISTRRWAVNMLEKIEPAKPLIILRVGEA